MFLHPKITAALGGLFLSLATATVLPAAGSPPMITDDPGTPGNGNWELNFGISTEKRSGERVSELPLIDLNYGIGDRWQLKYEVPYLQLKADGEPTTTGLGNSAFGVKWRFHDEGEKGLAVSVYPQVEFNNPGSRSDEKGLVEHGTTFLLPFQFQQEVGPVTLVWQVGREFRAAGDSWYYGLSAGHMISDKVELAVELAGGGDPSLARTQLTANVGLGVELSERMSLLFSAGRELHNHDEPRATFVGFLGVQLRL